MLESEQGKRSGRDRSTEHPRRGEITRIFFVLFTNRPATTLFFFSLIDSRRRLMAIFAIESRAIIGN